MQKKFALLVILVIFSCNIYAAQEPDNIVALDISKAVDMALKNSEDIKINLENLEKLENMYQEIRASIFPQVQGNIKINRFLKAPVLNIDMGMGNTSIPLASDWENSIGFQASQVLWAFGKVMNAIRLSEEYMNIAQYSEKITKNELTFAVKNLYYSLLMSGEMAKIARGSYNNALKNKSALKEKYSGGRTSNINNVKMEADISSRVPRMLEAEQSYKLVEVAIKDLLGIQESTSLSLEEGFIREFPVFDISSIEQKMLENEPVLLVFREKLALSDIQIKLKRSSFYPTLSGFMSYSLSGSDNNFIPENINPELIAGLMINYDLWDSGKKRSSLRQSFNDKNIAEYEYSKKKRALKVELKSALTEYNSLTEAYPAHKKAVKLAKESYDIALASFKAGSVSQTMLNDAELMLTGAKINELTALYKINIAIAKIHKLIAEGSER